MNEIPNAERTAKRQTNDQTLIKRPNAEQTRKSEGKSIFESFKLWDYTMFKMIIQTKICNLFQIFNLAFSFKFYLFYKQGYIFFVFTGLQTGLYFFCLYWFTNRAIFFSQRKEEKNYSPVC